MSRGPMVVIASRNAGRRKRWRQALQASADVIEVADGVGLERSMMNRRPAVLLLDLALIKPNGIQDLVRLQKHSPATRTVFFSQAPDDREAIQALRAGARGYCSADIDPPLLKKAVAMIQKGEIWVGRRVIHSLLEQLTALTAEQGERSIETRKGNLDQLSPRERQIVSQIARGLSNKEIAKHVEITERTVKAHLTSIFRKLHIPDRLRLALFVSGEMG